MRYPYTLALVLPAEFMFPVYVTGDVINSIYIHTHTHELARNRYPPSAIKFSGAAQKRGQPRGYDGRNNIMVEFDVNENFVVNRGFYRLDQQLSSKESRKQCSTIWARLCTCSGMYPTFPWGNEGSWRHIITTDRALSSQPCPSLEAGPQLLKAVMSSSPSSSVLSTSSC
nr:hypothetical protein L203_00477 [Cryptococcus depauperatus CBS 7841]